MSIGAGLDATFYRIDNKTIHWYGLDLLDVIELQNCLSLRLTGQLTSKMLSRSELVQVHQQTKNGVFMVADGLLRYFEEAQVK